MGRPPWPRERVDARFAEGGWCPGRDIGDEELARLVERAVVAYREDGHYDLELFPAAADFLREHGGCAFRVGDRPRDRIVFDPLCLYAGMTQEVAELARGLGLRVFPVGYEADEYPVFLIDESGRFFYLFWEELHYVGADKYEAFGGSLFGGPFAEDLYPGPPA